MPPIPLQLYVEFRCKAGHVDDVEHGAAELARRTREQPGCTHAFFYRVNEDAERFVFLAEFADEDSLEEHLEADWRQTAVSALADVLAEPSRRYTMRRVA